MQAFNLGARFNFGVHPESVFVNGLVAFPPKMRELTFNIPNGALFNKLTGGWNLHEVLLKNPITVFTQSNITFPGLVIANIHIQSITLFTLWE